MVDATKCQGPAGFAGVKFFTDQLQMEAGRNHCSSPVGSKATWRERSHPLEHEKPDAGFGAGRTAAKGKLPRTGIDPSDSVACEGSTGQTRNHRAEQQQQFE